MSSTRRRDDDVVFLVDLPDIPAPPAVPAAHHSAAPIAATPMRAAHEGTLAESSGHARSRSNGRRDLVPTPHESSLVLHRARLLAMRLEHMGLCPATRHRQLAEVGIQTAGDLIYSDPSKVAEAFGNSQRAERAIRRYRAAIKLALGVESMMPRDALLLVAIHRRSVASVARQSAAQLHRDLERFSLSSRGRKLIGRRSVPSQRRVKLWVARCREVVEAASAGTPRMARSAA